MPDDLSAAIDRLRTSTQRLNAICDEAAQTIRDTEAFLCESHVGVVAVVLVKEDPDEDEEHPTRVYLSYGRHTSGNFRILVSRVPPWAQEPSDEVVRPWSECPRDDKLDSFEKLPDLLVELARRVDDRTTKAQQTVTAVNALIQLPKKRKGG